MSDYSTLQAYRRRFHLCIRCEKPVVAGCVKCARCLELHAHHCRRSRAKKKETLVEIFRAEAIKNMNKFGAATESDSFL